MPKISLVNPDEPNTDPQAGPVANADRRFQARNAIHQIARFREANPRGQVPGWALNKVAASHNIHPETLRRYLRNGLPKQRAYSRAVANDDMCALVAHVGFSKKAWRIAVEEGTFTGSYATFLRALDRTNEGKAARKGLTNGQKALDKSSMYGTFPKDERNARWFLDHTEADIFVRPDKGTKIFRPWVTNVRDGASGACLASIAWPSNPTADAVVAAIASAMLGDTYIVDGVEVFLGGTPEALTLDNALEHAAEAVFRYVMAVDVLVDPIIPGHKHQQGSAENLNLAMTQEFLRCSPGHTGGGVKADGTPRFLPMRGKEIDPTRLWTFRRFQIELDKWRRDHNETDYGRQSPVRRWLDLAGEIRPAADEAILAGMLRQAKPAKVKRYGVYFQNLDFTHPALKEHFGATVTLKYLPGHLDFVDVWYEGRRICRAKRPLTLAPAEQGRMVQGRNNDRKIVERATSRANHIADGKLPALSETERKAAREAVAAAVEAEQAHGDAAKRFDDTRNTTKRGRASGRVTGKAAHARPINPMDVIKSEERKAS
jgi:hypothetical protein